MADLKCGRLDLEIVYGFCRYLKSCHKMWIMFVFSLILYSVILREMHAKRCVFKMLIKKYKKFWEERDIEAFTLIIDPEIEIIMHSTGEVIDYDLWMERITAVVLSNAYAENIRCLCENVEITIVHQITNAANGTRDVVLYVFTNMDGMLSRPETGSTPLPPKNLKPCF